MFHPDYQKDRYCKFVFNPDSQAFERLWIRYADNTFEPVRREGDTERKWTGPHSAWWVETRPADWLPWENGFGFAWNHTLGEATKPADWGGKSEAEQQAGTAPYFAEQTTDDQGRITTRTERIDGRRETWRFRYDRTGRLTSCFSANGWGLDWEYDDDHLSADYAVGRTPFMRVFKYDRKGRLLQADDTRYEYDAKGFRTACITKTGTTRYHHQPDGRLSLIETADGRLLEYRHDAQGRLQMRLVNGDPVATYFWRDDNRLAGFHDGYREWTLYYKTNSITPYSMSVDTDTFALAFDQYGSLKTVTNPRGTVIKATQYTPFGQTLWDSNPNLHLPLGFAGAIPDPDSGLLRFGPLSYDPDITGWTAPILAEKLGYHVPEDPVNGCWPEGLGV
ncbi:RHS repeat domain-containing protein [Pseudodesulfovibrio sp.]|uniref:RHS repeat domain-containing protein n=1 Tax=unclassified Pseudodesulfovibrio TaxID=2661612 RepID=UPI003AFFBDF6